MSVNSWSLVRLLHVLGAMFWVGGQLVLSGVVLPAVRRHVDPATRVPLVHAAARRFALAANVVVLPLMLATGLALAWHRGVTVGSFDDPGYGRLLAIKLAFVVLSVALATVHGIVATIRPAVARPLAMGGLASSVGIVVFATALVP